MKTSEGIRLAALSLAFAAMLTGCGSMNKSGVAGSEGRVVTLADGRTVVVSGQKQADGTVKPVATSKSDKKLAPPKKDGKASKPKKEKKGKKGISADAVGVDREAVGSAVLICGDDKHQHPSAETIAAKADSASVAGDDLKGVIADDFSLNGEWTVYSVRGNVVTGEERPYVTFDIPAKRFYGNNGCNYINGDLTVAVNHAVKFDNMISTMKMCQDDQFQYLINLALNDVVSYSARYEKPITFLDLKDAAGQTVLVLRRHNMDFLNGGWKVTELNGTPLVQEDDATMTFDTADLKIHGTTGCNIFNGEMFIDPDKTDSLQILQLVTTRMMCAPDSRETEFLLALESVETARRQSDGTVVLYSADGNQLFKLEKMDLRQASEE